MSSGQPLGLFANRRHVAATAEFRRIAGLPRRTWTDAELEALTARMTAALRAPGGTMTLRPIQALALYEILSCQGLFGCVGVGRGKTIISFLAQYVLESRRAILLLPASLVKKAEKERNTLMKHWRVDGSVRIVSYQELGRVNGAHILNTCQPDLIIADECHKVKSHRAGVTRRVARWMRDNPKTRFIAMSGTIAGSQVDLRDFAHILEWCLKDNAPIPSHDGELEEWADALGEATRVNPLKRVAPGALLDFATDAEKRELEPITAARRGFQRRLTETPGVVATSDDDVACSLIVEALEYDVSAVTEANFQKLRDTWTTPDDWDLAEAIEKWACARQLALGMHLVWDPRPPAEWRAARKAWKSFVREVLGRPQRRDAPLDTEKQVALACGKGELPREKYDAWVAIEPTFKVRSKAVWHDDSALRACEAWIKARPKGGVVWTKHAFFAEELSRRAGVPYFGAEGLDRYGNSLLALAGEGEDRTEGPTIIASIDANATGRNLQFRWHANLITSNIGALEAEQLLGRTHRFGQPHDEVIADVLMGCFEHGDGWAKALAGARAAQDMLGGSQKLMLADVVLPDVECRPGARWRK